MDREGLFVARWLDGGLRPATGILIGAGAIIDENASKRHHTPDRLALVHQLERLVDVR
jgi:hypothetical protein